MSTIIIFLTYTLFTDWRSIEAASAAAVLFKSELLQEAAVELPIRACIDLGTDLVTQTRDILQLYKVPEMNWARPLHCSLKGDPAIGVGVERHFLSLEISKLQQGFNIKSDVTNITLLFEGEKNHLLPATSEAVLEVDLFIVAGRIIGHSFLHGGPLLTRLSQAIIHMISNGDIDTATITIEDVADYDIRETIQMLDGDQTLSEEQRHRVNSLALSWDQSPLLETNRSWLFEKLLKHAVIVRRQRQIKQMKKGLRDTKVLTLIQQKQEEAEPNAVVNLPF
ncbi:hypothetical protein ACEWY4_009133 [Coilia grayii]|uniref:Uncharacterized protein n=1 Tax=Coilia grayii TaxID=363190 RepID=A0ABD1K5N7_9TELE